MKFLHTADLHIGKKIFELSLLEDQRHILRQIAEIARQERVDALVIAGDVYDRAVPSTEAVALLDEFLTGLQEQGVPVIMISGNHDSAERLSFADAILEKQGLYIAGGYQEPLKTVTLEDDFGPVHFVCMPFVKPAVLDAADSKEAVERMLGTLPMTLSMRQRYVLVTHYFVVGDREEAPERSDSEIDINVGGLDCVPASLFHNFCYVALGHLHKPQRVGSGQVYYAGTPLKYSFGEAKNEKSVNIVELDADGVVTVTPRRLTPLREMRCIRGELKELINPSVTAQNQDCREDYFQAVLTDMEELLDPMGTLRSVYPNTLQILLEKHLSPGDIGDWTLSGEDVGCRERGSVEELFGGFYEMLRGETLEGERLAVVREIAEELL